MGAVASFAKAVAKAAITGAGSVIPVIGGPLASWVNSKFAKGSFDIGTIAVDIPEDAKKKMINTPAQLKALVKANPEIAQKSGLTVEMIDDEVKEAKTQAKAVGGLVKMRDQAFVKTDLPKAVVKPAMAVGGKVKKARSKAQLEATKKLVEANRLRRTKK